MGVAVGATVGRGFGVAVGVGWGITVAGDGSVGSGVAGGVTGTNWVGGGIGDGLGVTVVAGVVGDGDAIAVAGGVGNSRGRGVGMRRGRLGVGCNRGGVAAPSRGWATLVGGGGALSPTGPKLKGSRTGGADGGIWAGSSRKTSA